MASSTQPSGTAAAEAVIFSIVPQGLNDNIKKRSRELEKRASGGFLNLAQDGVKDSCTDASTFALAGGELIVDGYPIWATPSSTYILLTDLGAPGGFGTPGEEVITRTFEVDDGGYLRWANETFRNGEATFCQLVSSDSAQVYLIFSSQESDQPAGCQAVSLRTFRGESRTWPLGAISCVRLS